MTSRHAHDDTRWELGPVAGPSDPRDHAGLSTPVPESVDLPPRLDTAVTALTELRGSTVSFTVQPDPESVTEARHFAISRLAEWDLSELADDVGLVVSELVTNALRHSGGVNSSGRPGVDVHREGVYGDPADPLGSAPSAIRLRLGHEAPWLLCGIMDASRAAPRRREPDYIAETGRGLHLVESFSVRWGWRGLDHGKVVWALFRAP
ncbi:Histidine kinase-like ATPase domain-containing protein [Actinomadura meyerae]|uniref:Histidine kinase-like ATPase domain-containing protein n=1 Tax=Actinomadura meyerae TaxID=240840 RepID=A0A239JLH4_9ACTN|nr:ATP-binding protein [Actinomadura meyerae]SNT06670.1 Histidine kinase-like ATPase domain-containing protein [Actinomadura meyerae]